MLQIPIGTSGGAWQQNCVPKEPFHGSSSSRQDGLGAGGVGVCPAIGGGEARGREMSNIRRGRSAFGQQAEHFLDVAVWIEPVTLAVLDEGVDQRRHPPRFRAPDEQPVLLAELRDADRVFC